MVKVREFFKRLALSIPFFVTPAVMDAEAQQPNPVAYTLADSSLAGQPQPETGGSFVDLSRYFDAEGKSIQPSKASLRGSISEGLRGWWVLLVGGLGGGEIDISEIFKYKLFT